MYNYGDSKAEMTYVGCYNDVDNEMKIEKIDQKIIRC